MTNLMHNVSTGLGLRKSLQSSLILPLLSLAVAMPVAAMADFSGPFAPANWSLINNNADGSVNTAGAPGSIVLNGGDDGSWLFGTTDYVIQALFSGEVFFNWVFDTQDEPTFDSAGWLRNGVYTDLAGDLPWAGSVSFVVNAGDVFGFRATTSDNANGRGFVTISQFQGPVPEPGSVSLVLLGAGILALLRRKQA